MSYPINYPTPQNANFQEFYGGGSTRDWVKPQGASMVRMLLIGAGGGGGGAGFGTANGGNPGGSGAVTQWIGPAMFIPDVLRVSIGLGGNGGTGSGGTSISVGTAGTASSIIFQAKDSTGYTLLTANGGNGGGTGTTVGAGGTAMSNNFFGAAGIFKSVAGQTATRNANTSASTTTFLTAGASGATATSGISGYTVTPAYGYPTISGGAIGGGNGNNGIFLLQPIMVGCGGSGGANNTSGVGPGGNGGRGGIGCGGGGGGRTANSGETGGSGGRGGDGAVFIWSW